MIATAKALDLALTAALEAHEPPEARGLERDQVRLLVTSDEGRGVEEARFREFPRFVAPGDLVVANDSATIPAAVTATMADGTAIAFHFSAPTEDGCWVVEPRKAAVESGDVVALPAGGTATLLARYEGSERLWVARLNLPGPVLEYLRDWGRPITYTHVRGQWPLEMYQTVYARDPGSAEMPSAGRAFTAAVLDALSERGIGFVTLTLHTGVSSLEKHESPYEEQYRVSPATAEAVTEARRCGGRIIAVGTTVMRALETVATEDGAIAPGSGRTRLVISPGRRLRAVDGLLTGFHEPESSHLAILEAVAGRRHLERAYQAALDGGYLWHEFGDLHLILP